MSSLALLGYGEVGRILTEDLRAQRVAVTAHDLSWAALRVTGCGRMQRSTGWRWPCRMPMRWVARAW